MPAETWQILQSDLLINHPFLTVHAQTVQLPDGRIIPQWHHVHTRDYVNALVLNADNQALILEGYKHGLGKSSWQILGGYLEDQEQPLAAAQRELLEETGYQSNQWQHLGSFVIDANRYVGTGHFFLARHTHLVSQPNNDDLEQVELKWVSLAELQEALFDGRIAIASYAINIALGLLWLSYNGMVSPK